MIVLALVLLALVLSWALGGRIEDLASVKFRHSWLILLALSLQVLIFSPWWRQNLASRIPVEWAYLVSMTLLVLVTCLNWRVPGVVILGIGLLLNASVIFANGGHMPTSLNALKYAGIVDEATTLAQALRTNSSLITDETSLWFLGDVFAIPGWFPLANIYSVGDVVLAIGGALFVFINMRANSSITGDE